MVNYTKGSHKKKGFILSSGHLSWPIFWELTSDRNSRVGFPLFGFCEEFPPLCNAQCANQLLLSLQPHGHHHYHEQLTCVGTRSRPCCEDPRPPMFPAGSSPTCKGFNGQGSVAGPERVKDSQSSGQSLRRKATVCQALASTLADGVGSCWSGGNSVTDKTDSNWVLDAQASLAPTPVSPSSLLS